jgi:hypothetical protein
MSPSRTDQSETHAQNGTARDYARAEGGESAAHDFYHSWMDMYQQWSEEGMTAFQKGIEATQRMMPFTPPGQEMMNLWMDSMQSFSTRISQELGQDGSPQQAMAAMADPTAYKKMYDVWLDTWSTQLEGYLRSPEFAAKSGRDLEAFSDWKKKLGEVMEAYWESIHLPSSADMREIYHKLYLMDRKLDDMDRRFRTIEKHLAQLVAAKK